MNGLATLKEVKCAGENFELIISIDPKYSHYIIPEGSVTLNGIALTVSKVFDELNFGVSIIPHTWQVTNLKNLKVGDALNLEVDLLMKYVESLISTKNKKLKSESSESSSEKEMSFEQFFS